MYVIAFDRQLLCALRRLCSPATTNAGGGPRPLTVEDAAVRVVEHPAAVRGAAGPAALVRPLARGRAVDLELRGQLALPLSDVLLPIACKRARNRG